MSEERITHKYRVSIPVTKQNRKELGCEYGKALMPGDTLILNTELNVKPVPTMVGIYQKAAEELGGSLEWQMEQVITSEWKKL